MEFEIHFFLKWSDSYLSTVEIWKNRLKKSKLLIWSKFSCSNRQIEDRKWDEPIIIKSEPNVWWHSQFFILFWSMPVHLIVGPGLALIDISFKFRSKNRNHFWPLSIYLFISVFFLYIFFLPIYLSSFYLLLSTYLLSIFCFLSSFCLTNLCLSSLYSCLLLSICSQLNNSLSTLNFYHSQRDKLTNS